MVNVVIDRTGELRKLGFEGRRLGKEQMTTDTAARVTRMVVGEKSRCCLSSSALCLSARILRKHCYFDRPSARFRE
jgi:hypothetical protein